MIDNVFQDEYQSIYDNWKHKIDLQNDLAKITFQDLELRTESRLKSTIKEIELLKDKYDTLKLNDILNKLNDDLKKSPRKIILTKLLKEDGQDIKIEYADWKVQQVLHKNRDNNNEPIMQQAYNADEDLISNKISPEQRVQRIYAGINRVFELTYQQQSELVLAIQKAASAFEDQTITMQKQLIDKTQKLIGYR